jgi:hypothetical protein
LGEERTHRGHRISVETDPERTWRLAETGYNDSAEQDNLTILPMAELSE